MGVQEYRRVLAVRDVRRILLLGMIVRVPMWAGNVVLTLHVVTHLHHSYAAAGLLVGVVTVALALSGPWRGKRLDRVGLRATLAPSLVVLAACWSVAPFLGYLPLLVLASVAGLFEIPSFSIVRQTLIRSVHDDQRRTVLSVDSVAVEISFMIGPVLGVLLATYTDTTWALLSCELASVLGGVLMWVVNPPIAPLDAQPSAAPGSGAARRRLALPAWLRPDVVAIFAVCVGAVLVLSGTDVAIVAALRHMGHQPSIGWMLAVWGLGSAIGGVIYGAMHRSVPAFWLLAMLSATTLPVGLADSRLTIALLLFVAGVFCAPTITATVDALSRAVPPAVRGEALGWHGSALLVGSAAGAPLAGVAVDAVGWPGGFLLPSAVGLAIAVVGGLAAARWAPRRPPAANVSVEPALDAGHDLGQEPAREAVQDVVAVADAAR